MRTSSGLAKPRASAPGKTNQQAGQAVDRKAEAGTAASKDSKVEGEVRQGKVHKAATATMAARELAAAMAAIKCKANYLFKATMI